MADGKQCRLRLRLPSGAELEAEGTPEFITGERREFTRLLRPENQYSAAPPKGLPAQGETGGREGEIPVITPHWAEITELRDQCLILRAKLGKDRSEGDACLVLIAASKALLRTPKPTAAQIARWLRLSGYPVSRVDRALQAGLEGGQILASGSRRARRYELSGPGLARAHNLATELSQAISGS